MLKFKIQKCLLQGITTRQQKNKLDRIKVYAHKLCSFLIEIDFIIDSIASRLYFKAFFSLIIITCKRHFFSSLQLYRNIYRYVYSVKEIYIYINEQQSIVILAIIVNITIRTVCYEEGEQDCLQELCYSKRCFFSSEGEQCHTADVVGIAATGDIVFSNDKPG